MFVSGWFPLPSLLSHESLVSVKEYANRKRKKRRKKEKKSNRTQTKLNAPHVQYNVKIITQYLIIRDKQISQEKFERKVLRVISRFSTQKSFKNWESTCFSKEKYK